MSLRKQLCITLLLLNSTVLFSKKNNQEPIDTNDVTVIKEADDEGASKTDCCTDQKNKARKEIKSPLAFNFGNLGGKIQIKWKPETFVAKK